MLVAMHAPCWCGCGSCGCGCGCWLSAGKPEQTCLSTCCLPGACLPRRRMPPGGSPFTRMARVIGGAFAHWRAKVGRFHRGRHCTRLANCTSRFQPGRLLMGAGEAGLDCSIMPRVRAAGAGGRQPAARGGGRDEHCAGPGQAGPVRHCVRVWRGHSCQGPMQQGVSLCMCTRHRPAGWS